MDMNNIENAKRILREGNYTFAACSGDKILTSTQRGVAPLLNLIDAGESLNGWSVADKVIGRAAAFLYVLLGAKEIWSGVISRPALEVFRDFGVEVSCGETVELIMNRSCTGLCPMESSVLGIKDPAEAEKAIRKKLLELRQTE